MCNHRHGLCAIHGLERPVVTKQHLNTFIQSVLKEFEAVLEDAVRNFVTTRLCSCANEMVSEATGSSTACAINLAAHTQSLEDVRLSARDHATIQPSVQPLDNSEGPVGTPVIRVRQPKTVKREATHFNIKSVASLLEVCVSPHTPPSVNRETSSSCSTGGKTTKKKNDISSVIHNSGRKQSQSTCGNNKPLYGVQRAGKTVLEEPLSASATRCSPLAPGPVHGRGHLKNLSPRVSTHRQTNPPPVRSRLKSENNVALKHLKRSGWVSRNQLEKRRREVGLFSQTPCKKESENTHNKRSMREESLENRLTDKLKQGEATSVAIRSGCVCDKLPRSPGFVVPQASAVAGCRRCDGKRCLCDNSRGMSFAEENRRKTAPGISCSECEAFYAAFNNPAPTEMTLHGESATFGQNVVEPHLSKHRAYEFPPPTPAGYWDVDFPESLTTLTTQSRIFK